MRRREGGYFLSATDLVGHMGCKRLTELNRAVADGVRSAPPSYPDPALDALVERGQRHEAAYVEYCRGSGCGVTDLSDVGDIGATDAAVQATLEAMQAGAAIIVQGALRSESWGGRADILRRVERPSQLGSWSYEVLDTKLAREAQGSAVLQLCLYSELLGLIQGVMPERAYIVMPGDDPLAPFNVQPFRLDDFAAYYRRIKGGLERALQHPSGNTYPEPVERCEICRWFEECDTRRRDDDHLSFVAGLAKSHAAELQEREIATLARLAATPLPLPWRPRRGAGETFERLREQARLQLQTRTSESKIPAFEVLEAIPGLGLSRLPEPSPGDIFLDLEGATFVAPHGREYLFGYVVADGAGNLAYHGIWAATPEQEKAAFEAFIDLVGERLNSFPDLHVYHYAPYEPGAFKRLMGRYATRENELDALLRSNRFVDLYAVVRQGVRCGVESYSIKKLEVFYGFVRTAHLRDAGQSLLRVETALELGEPLDLTGPDCEVVRSYNEDDCRSTAALRDWLESLRTARIAEGAIIDRPLQQAAEPPEALSARDQAVAGLVLRLSADIPADADERSAEQHARWLLAQCLSWHRREQKAVWWEYFRLAELGADDLIDERAAVSGLTFDSVTEPGRAPVHRYRFPPQETDLRGGEELRADGGDKLGKVHAISLDEGWIDIKKRQDTAGLHPTAAFGFDNVPTDTLAAALMRVGEHIANYSGPAPNSPYAAAWALLTRHRPLDGALLAPEGVAVLEAALQVGGSLEAGVLPIQGPPGAGKTFTGGQMICDLVRAGKRVGVTANSHKVISHLLEGALQASIDGDVTMRCVQKVGDAPAAPGAIQFETDNAAALASLDDGANVVGGTAWFWARPDAESAVDVLFVDEAAQMSLANVLAVSHVAPVLVLLGDPRQLEQPMKGSHPEGSDVSALDHLLDGAQTISPDRGLFLAETWRLHPDICAFTSELFYESRLHPREGLNRQTVKSTSRLNGYGLRYLPVRHAGNQNTAPEEVEIIAALVEEVLAAPSTWIDRAGVEKPIQLDDILIVAPYNAQVFELQQRLPNARIGTVDKFQGQEAPIVIYSMTSSSAADAPRGMEFLFSLNRLNVATSRARCLCVLVASPDLFGADCRSPRQMQLANALCRYTELAEEI